MKEKPCVKCGERKQYDSNGLCIQCNFIKMCSPKKEYDMKPIVKTMGKAIKRLNKSRI